MLVLQSLLTAQVCRPSAISQATRVTCHGKGSQFFFFFSPLLEEVDAGDVVFIFFSQPAFVSLARNISCFCHQTPWKVLLVLMLHRRIKR